MGWYYFDLIGAIIGFFGIIIIAALWIVMIKLAIGLIIVSVFIIIGFLLFSIIGAIIGTILEIFIAVKVLSWVKF